MTRDLKKINRFRTALRRQRAVVYARYSPRPNEDSRTIDSQFDYCELYCQRSGTDIDSKFADQGVSGTELVGREQLELALQRCEAIRGMFVCYSMSRLARSTKDAIEIHDRLYRAGCDLVLLDIQVDTTTAAGKMLFSIMAAVAECEAQQRAATTSEAMKRYQRSGYAMGKVPPYGWKLGNDFELRLMPDGRRKALRTIVPDDHEQRGLDLMMLCNAKGWSSRQIADHANLCGFKNRENKKFDGKTVWKIVQRELNGMNPARVTANTKFVQDDVGLVPVDKPIISHDGPIADTLPKYPGAE